MNEKRDELSKRRETVLGTARAIAEKARERVRELSRRRRTEANRFCDR